MGRIADFVTEIEKYSSPIYGGFTADPHFFDDRMLGIKVTKRLRNKSIELIVSCAMIETIRATPESYAQAIMKELNEYWRREARKSDA